MELMCSDCGAVQNFHNVGDRSPVCRFCMTVLEIEEDVPASVGLDAAVVEDEIEDKVEEDNKVEENLTLDDNLTYFKEE